MALKNFVIFSILSAAGIIGVTSEEPEKLLRADDAYQHEFPYMVAIKKNGQLHCGGAIISEKVILTAAHCVNPLVNDPFADVTVVTGTNDLMSGGQTHKVAKYFYHNKWDTQVSAYRENTPWNYDIGAIVLAAPIQYNAWQKPISLPTSPPPAYQSALVTGWGITEYKQISQTLKKLELRIIPVDVCQRYHNYKVQDFHICTYRGSGVGTCNGDSGSPLVYNGAIVGVVSGGIPCAVGAPDIFTNVYALRPFVDYVLKNQN